MSPWDVISWAAAIGAGVAVAVGTFLWVSALLGVEWHRDRERKT